MTAPAKKKLTGWAVFWGVVAFFTTVAAVDAVFIYFAVHSYSGTVTEQPYETGLAYNETIAAAEKQAALDVQSKGGFEDGYIVLDLRTKAGTPIANAKVSGRIMRPVNERDDIDIVFENAGNGIYKAEMKGAATGLWIARTEAAWDNRIYRSAYKFIVK